MRKIIISAVLILLTAAFAFGQELEWYVNKPIKDVTFSGLNHINPSELEGITSQFKGKTFSDTLFWDLQSKLYALNYFETFTANALPGNDEQTEVIIEFTVTERPLVDKIILSGNKSVNKNDIMDVILTKKDDILNKARIRMDTEAIKNLYTDEGYPDAEIENSISSADTNGLVDITFAIVEGSQTRIKNISFSGNTFASENTLKGQLKSKQQSFFTTGIYKESRIEEDKAALLKYYMDSGYIDAKILDVAVEEAEDDSEERNYVNITFYIEEGAQWKFGGFSFSGNTLFTDEELLKQVSSKPGSILNRTKLESDYMLISDKYYNDGYIYNTISRQETRNEQTKEISYKVTISELSRAHIENIIVKGNEKTKEYVILREIPLEVGDIFSKSAIMQGLNNLYNTRYFTSVIPEMPYGSESGLMDLVINVEEDNTTDIQFGMTFTSTESSLPIIGFLKWTDTNFLGEGNALSVGVELSTATQEVTFSWDDGWLFDQRISAGVDFSISHNLYSSVPQDVMYPIFDIDDDDNIFVVPDPFDGHLVWASDASDNSYSAGEALTDAELTALEASGELQTLIDEGDVLTDYDYAVSQSETIGSEYLMSYESFDFSLGGNAGYSWHTPYGRLGVGTGASTTLSYAQYDSSIYRPYDKTIRDALDTWQFVNKLWTTASWDTRDLTYSPTKGYQIKETLTYTGGFLFGSRHYIKTKTDVDAYFKLFDISLSEEFNLSMVMGLHSQFSMILDQFYYDSSSGSWTTDTVATRSDLLYFDGMFIARGWGYNYDNKVLWDNVIDFTTPVAPGMLSWVNFFSSTAVWDEVSDLSGISLDDFYFSFGTGLQVDIPSFPISFFLAKRFNFDSEGTFQWQQGDLFAGDSETGGLDFVVSFDLDYF